MFSEFNDIVDVSVGQVSVTGDVVYPMADVVLYVNERLKNVSVVKYTQIQYNEEGIACSIVLEINLPNGTTPAGVLIIYPAVRELDFYDVTVLWRSLKYLTAWKFTVSNQEDKELLEECCKFVGTWIICLEKKS